MEIKLTPAERETLRQHKKTVAAIWRALRPCPVSMIAILLELSISGDLSGLALHNRCKIKNPRSVLLRGKRNGFVSSRKDAYGDTYWTLEEKGIEVINRILNR